MKIRLGFVSNSSASSFIIYKGNLTKKQINKIKSHGSFIGRNKRRYGHLDDHDHWLIEEDPDYIYGSTIMDNFDMYNYLSEIVGVDMNHVQWRN